MRRPRTFIGPSGMAGMVGLWGASSLIARIQRGTISIAAGSTSNTGAISPVTLDSARIVFLGTISPSAAGGPSQHACRVELTSAAVVTAYVNSTSAAARDVAYEVIEYLPGVIKGVQRGTLGTSGAASNTATITAVDTAKSVLDALGFTGTSTTEAGSNMTFQMVLTNATTITGTGQTADTRTCGYQVVEFF